MGRKIEYANEEQFKTLRPGCKFEVLGMSGSFTATSEPFIDEMSGDLSILARGVTISYKNSLVVTQEADEGKIYNVDVRDVKSLAYKLYQLNWKEKNRITPSDEIEAMKAYLKVYPPEKFTVANPPDETFDEWLPKHGYEGSFYHSYEYFCEHVYNNSFYIESLLAGTKEVENYRKDLISLREEKIEESEKGMEL